MTTDELQMRLAIFQCSAAGLTPAQRLRRLEAAVTEADADLLLCPELFMSGYAIAHDIQRFAEPADGWFASEAACIAKDTCTALVYGYPERADGYLYNAAHVIDAAGCCLANHRKLAIPPGLEAGLFVNGEGVTFFETCGFRFAVLICYDAEFPEAVRFAAKAGAHVILVPTALKEQWRVVAEQVMPARAFENGVYLLYANHAGCEGAITYLGSSCIVGPDGKDMQRAGSAETVVSATVQHRQVDMAQRELPYLDDVGAVGLRLAPR
ncbi:MAG: carbon-nitrogen hydrolase family protein [Granulosicoccus sp.]